MFNYKIVAPLFFSVMATTSAMAASFTAYSDRSAFEAALSGVVTEDFNSYVSDESFDGGSVDVGDFTVSADATHVGRNIIDVLPAATNATAIDGTTYLAAFLTNSDMSFTFDSAINAIGFDQYAFGNGVGNGSMSILGETFLDDLIGTSSEAGFFGVIFDTAFTQIDFFNVQNDGFSIDNVAYQFADTAVVPVPASLPLLIAGLAAFSVARRRKSK